ncbi:MAG: DUF3857 domain-containing protein [Spirochaetales bacterium]|nr:DUF3857 domain-containing protein [Spirochaetales bacterium]
MKKKILLGFLLLLAALPFWSKDTECMVILKNGAEYRGNLLDINANQFIFDFPDGKKEINKSEIYLLSFSKTRKYQNIQEVSQIEDSEITEAVKKAAAYKPEQNENMVILLDKTNYTFNGTNIICTQKKIIKILNEAGKENSIQMVNYNAKNNETCDLVYAITVTPDGKVFSLQDDAINNEPTVQDGRLYQGKRRIKFSMPNPEIGNLLIYECQTQFPADSLFSPICEYFYLCGSYNIIKKELSFTDIPYPLEISQEKGEVKGIKPQIIKDKNNITIKAQNIKRVTISEPYLPDDSVLYPNIRISSKFDDICAVKYFQPQTCDSDSFNRFLTENNFNSIKNIDDLKKVYSYFQDRIIQKNYFMSTQAYKISDIDNMLQEKKLSPLDKTALFASVLKCNGIKSNFVFYAPQETATKKLINNNNLDLFTETALLVNFNNEEIILSFEDKNIGFAVLPDDSSFASAMIIKENNIEYKLLPDVTPENNKIVINMTGSLEEDGTLHLDRRFIISGENSKDYRSLRFLSEEEKNRFFREIVSSVKIGSKSQKWSINSDLENKNIPVDFSDSLLIPDYSVISGDIYLFELPHFEYDLCDLTSNSRDYTVNWQEKGIKECNYEITLPENLKVKYMPKSQSFSFKNENFQASFQNDGNTLKISYSSLSNTAFVPLKDYKKLQTYLNQRMELSKQYIILEKTK